MPRLPEAARARKGRPILPAWEALEKFVDGYEVTVPGGQRVRELPDETILFQSNRQKGWPHPWKSSLSGGGATVAPGFVNGEMPRAGEALLTLEGRDLDGKLLGRRPVVAITRAEQNTPGRDGRSFLCIRLVVDPATGEAAKEALPADWLTVVHRSALPPGYESGGLPETLEAGYSVGYFAIAILYWTPDRRRIERLFHPAHHSLQHQWIRGATLDDGSVRPNRHRFYV
jgi:hypothetical protein